MIGRPFSGDEERLANSLTSYLLTSSSEAHLQIDAISFTETPFAVPAPVQDATNDVANEALKLRL